METGKLIKELRIKKGMTQEELADKQKSVPEQYNGSRMERSTGLYPSNDC